MTLRNGKHHTRPAAVRHVNGAHTVYTEVQTLEEAVDLLARRRTWKMPSRPRKPITLKALSSLGALESKHAKRIVGLADTSQRPQPKPYPLSQTSDKGAPQLYHVVCGRCGTPREQTINKVCAFYLKTKCLGELMRSTR